MSLSLAAINWWAVLVAAVAGFMVGGVWYGALAAKAWVRVHGFSADTIERMRKLQARNFSLFFVLDIVMALVLALLTGAAEATSAGQGALLGALLWAGVAAPIAAAKDAACVRPFQAWAIDTGHELALLVVMGAILGAWR